MQKSPSVYLIYSELLGLHKIGVSGNVSKRTKQLQTGCPYSIEVKSIFKTEFPFKVETALHNRYSHLKRDLDNDGIEGEWFCLSNKEIAEFTSICENIEDGIKNLISMGNPFI